MRTIPGKITLNWISGHTDVKGNEEADKLAKEAATGQSSEKPSPPTILCQALGHSMSAEKQAYHEELLSTWKERWDASPRKTKFRKIDDQFPFTKFRKICDHLNRTQSSTLVQIRTGHIPLNKRLFKMGKAESDKCQTCNIGRRGERPKETVEHFLFECRAHQVIRNEFLTIIRCKRPKLIEILQDIKKTKALLRYVARTKRLKGFDPDNMHRN